VYEGIENGIVSRRREENAHSMPRLLVIRPDRQAGKAGHQQSDNEYANAHMLPVHGSPNYANLASCCLQCTVGCIIVA